MGTHKALIFSGILGYRRGWPESISRISSVGWVAGCLATQLCGLLLGWVNEKAVNPTYSYPVPVGILKTKSTPHGRAADKL